MTDDCKNSRLKILISAYACTPNRASEEGVGWECVRALAEHHDLWVITRGDARPAIETYLAQHELPGVTFEYYELPPYLRPGSFGVSTRPTQLYYYLWQIGIRAVAKKIIAGNGIDVVHHVTFVKYWAPTFLASLSKPLLWGPVGGGETAPAAFFPSFSNRGRIYELLRDLGRWIGEHDPFVRRAARRAVMTLASTAETADRIRRINRGGPVRVCPAIGVTDAELALYDETPSPPESGIRFVSIGRLLHWKGFHLGIAAFARAAIPGSEYLVIGDGPERSRLEALAKELGVSDRVSFLGNISRDQVLQHLARCHVLVHPSLHESGGGVCLEAMVARLPAIVLDLGGPALHHADGAGVKVPADTPEQAASDLAVAMRDLAGDPQRRRQLADCGHRRLLDRYRWSEKARFYTSVYRSMLGRGSAVDERPGVKEAMRS
jgi:glycosyltransferase involved in cell wall biosynthesis